MGSSKKDVGLNAFCIKAAPIGLTSSDELLPARRTSGLSELFVKIYL